MEQNIAEEEITGAGAADGKDMLIDDEIDDILNNDVNSILASVI